MAACDLMGVVPPSSRASDRKVETTFRKIQCRTKSWIAACVRQDAGRPGMVQPKWKPLLRPGLSLNTFGAFRQMAAAAATARPRLAGRAAPANRAGARDRAGHARRARRDSAPPATRLSSDPISPARDD